SKVGPASVEFRAPIDQHSARSDLGSAIERGGGVPENAGAGGSRANGIGHELLLRRPKELTVRTNCSDRGQGDRSGGKQGRQEHLPGGGRPAKGTLVIRDLGMACTITNTSHSTTHTSS